MIRTRLQGDTPFFPNMLNNGNVEVCLKEDVDKALAEKDKEIAELKKKLMPCLNGDCILTCEVVEKYGKENRRLKRALWLARAERAEARKNYWYVRSCHEGDDFLVSIDGSPVKYIGCIKRTNYDWLLTWSEVESKCRAKAEEYK